MKTPQDHYNVQQAVITILKAIGENPAREGLLETPQRVARSYAELFSGYAKDPGSVFKTFEDGACDEMIVCKGIELFSHCEHHMLPFYGTAHIGYVPKGRIIGLSKLARLVEVFSRRLQVQERLTMQITEAMDRYLQPLGAACVLECKHFCMVCRGVQKQHSTMITNSLTGVFRTDAAARSEFFTSIR